MPRQLIFTSAPRGLTPGQSGYCTVGRSRDLREGLISRLEKLSYYTPEPNHNPEISAHRIVEMRGVRYHVLSRIVDAGLDFTKRRKFLAHHLVFEPHDLEGAPTPTWFFSKWSGWMNRWEGDPRWLPDIQPPNSITDAPTNAKLQHGNVFVTGDQNERTQFTAKLHALISTTSKPWEITFTNCFQPGDEAEDFQIKAVWPATPGYELAAKTGEHFLRLEDLQVASQANEREPVAVPKPVPSKTESAPAPKKQTRPLWSAAAAAAAVLVVAVSFILRERPGTETPVQSKQSIPPGLKQEESAATPAINVDEFLPPIPTWITIADAGALGSAPQLERIFKLLSDSELFGKDINATLQTNPPSKPMPAEVDAQPHENRIRFRAGPTELQMTLTGGVVKVKTKATQPLALEINSQQNVLVIPQGAPVRMSAEFLAFSTNTLTASFSPALETRLQKIVLPTAGQLALRPTRDPLAKIEDDFALLPSTTFDLRAIRSQVHHVVSAKEKSVESLRAELEKLKTAEKKLITQGQSHEELKRKERMAALELAVPRATQELKKLKEQAAKVPKEFPANDSFSLFLCLSNVNTEIIRFASAPNLAHAGSP